EAVIANGEKESGITIHLVNEVFDSGKTLFQTTCPVLPTDKPEDLAARVHALEYKYFPQVVEQYICKK
ncbi:MAG: phosphoribosylglycinamide formyltransferase, partial [Bacteroidales bacterium]|nr:phosphoribosylglycinamide formyltransferase [Bacteroidales bacterium]